MANQRVSRLSCVALLSLGLALGSSARAATPIPVADDAANCVWLKVHAAAVGYELPAADANLGPRRALKADCYLQLVYMASSDPSSPHGRYGGPLLCPMSVGDAVNWHASAMNESFSGDKLGDGNIVATDDYLTFTNAGGDVIQGWGNHRVLITVDKNGIFKAALFQTLGGEMVDQSTFFQTPAKVFGSYTAKGVSVPDTKVPDGAKALVADSPCNAVH